MTLASAPQAELRSYRVCSEYCCFLLTHFTLLQTQNNQVCADSAHKPPPCRMYFIFLSCVQEMFNSLSEALWHFLSDENPNLSCISTVCNVQPGDSATYYKFQHHGQRLFIVCLFACPRVHGHSWAGLRMFLLLVRGFSTTDSTGLVLTVWYCCVCVCCLGCATLRTITKMMQFFFFMRVRARVCPRPCATRWPTAL